jgi:hypothetical protein
MTKAPYRVRVAQEIQSISIAAPHTAHALAKEYGAFVAQCSAAGRTPRACARSILGGKATPAPLIPATA